MSSKSLDSRLRVWRIVWWLGCWSFRLPRRFAKFQWGHCTTRGRFDLQKSTRLHWYPFVPMCEKDFPLWRLRSLAYSTKTISSEKWEMKKEEKKEREVDKIKLFATFLPPPNKKIRNRRMEQWNKESTAFLTRWRVAKTSCLNGFHLIPYTPLCSFIWKRISPLG